MKRAAIFFTILCCASHAFSSETIIRVSFLEADRQDEANYFASMTNYYIGLLKLSLDQTLPTDGPYRIQNSGITMSQRRAFEALRQDNIDIFWSMTSVAREKIALPVRIPLLKGMLGHRVFIIRDDDQFRFDQIKNLEDLTFMVAGQGVNWPDYDILKMNGLKVIGGSSYSGLFSMLQRGRFDYFPRGINEPWTEIITHKEKNLSVEKNLLLRYAAPIYFFISNHNTELRNRLTRGLQLAIENGAFHNFIYNHPAIKNILNKIDLKKRVIFNLKSNLTPESAAILGDKKLWYQPGEEEQWIKN